MVEESLPISSAKYRIDTFDALYNLRRRSFIFPIFSSGNGKVIVSEFTINQDLTHASDLSQSLDVAIRRSQSPLP